MIEEINAALAAVGRNFGDRRIHYCRITAGGVDGGRCTLAGAVLDRETLASVSSALAERFPSLTIDDEAVAVLRQQPPRLLTVATNVTGLYAEPSFGSEMQSQVLDGWAVEQLRQEGRWAFVRLADGYLGWVYAPYLAAETAPEVGYLVGEPTALLRAEPAPDAPLAGRLVAGTGVAVADGENGWAQVTLPCDRRGWLPLSALRALAALPAGAAQRRQQMVEDSRRYLGVPYVWGGITAMGIDCSGYVHLLHRLAGMPIPRDADMQFAAGRPLQPPFRPGDLLFFGSEGAHRAISHVGMSLGGWRIIHASRSRNGVYVDDVQKAAWLRDIFVGACTFLA